jgi:hypothetical protein
LIGVMSLLVGSTGLVINILLSRNFGKSLPQAIADASRLEKTTNKAIASEAAAEAAEAASEQRARANPPRGLTREEAEAVIQKAESAYGTMKDAQHKTLISELTKNGQRIIDPTIPIYAVDSFHGGRLFFDQPREQIITAVRMANPLVVFQVIHRQSAKDHPTITQLDLSPEGELINLDVDSPAGREFGGRQPSQIEMSYWGLSVVNTREFDDAEAKYWSLAVAFVAAGLGGLLSILLLVGGILILMPARSDLGVRLHWIYVVGKILVVLLSTWAFYGAAADPGSDVEDIGQFIAGVFGFMGCVYPLFLAFLLWRCRNSEGSASPGGKFKVITGN